MNVSEEFKLFAKEVRLRREAKGLNQERLAELVGLSRVSITNIEAARHECDFRFAVRISSVLGINLNRFKPKLKLNPSWELK